MYSKTIKAKVIGYRSYTGKTEEGKEYKTYYQNIYYKDDENKYVYGYITDSIKIREPLTTEGEYELVVVTQKVGEKYYKEIVSANYIKQEK